MEKQYNAIYLDCFAGISGNMLLGAFLDAGVPEELLRTEIAKLPLTGYELKISQVDKNGISAVYVDVEVDETVQAHRNLADIIAIIEQSTLAPAVKETSKNIFRNLANAESKVHGLLAEEIHFHEVGAVDSIIDIVGAAWAIDYLQIEHIYISKLQVGTGFVKCCHGMIPVPAPATAELLHGIPYYAGEISRELVTPTGAAVARTLGSGFGNMPQDFISARIGYGAGTWELEIPNVLRLYLGRIPAGPANHAGQSEEQCIVIETNIDDQSPEGFEYVMTRLFAAGALDVWLTPIMMKKNRLASKLSVLTTMDYQAKITEAIFEETNAIGMRFYPVSRTKADREFIVIGLPWGDVKVKVSAYQGKVCNVAPEYDDCRKIAEQTGMPLKVIQQLALKEAMSIC